MSFTIKKQLLETQLSKISEKSHDLDTRVKYGWEGWEGEEARDDTGYESERSTLSDKVTSSSSHRI